jgi:hypothetical protein
MQTHADKLQAIQSLLFLLFAHRDHIPGAMRTARQEWISEPSPLDEPVDPPAPYNLACSGQCWTCRALQQQSKVMLPCPPEELWIREYRRLRREYRIEDIEKAMLDLGREHPSQAQAVWAVWIEPWPGELVDLDRPALGTRTEAISWETRVEREALALDGLDWLADNIEGYVRAFGERVVPRDNEIRRMLADGVSQRRIARELRCSLRDVRRVAMREKSTVGG